MYVDWLCQFVVAAVVAAFVPVGLPGPKKGGNWTEKGGAEHDGLLIWVQFSLRRVCVRVEGRMERQEVPGLVAVLEG